MSLESLKPSRVWYYFEEICKVPRPSKKEERIIKYLLDFGNSNGLETYRDEAGNVLIKKPATQGMENCPCVVLQSHIDMVCEKNNDTVHDFDRDAIKPYIDNGWVRAEGTTLGADDGIGMAAQLALLEAVDIPHGPIECLFTVDEETGLTGAKALAPDFIKGRILLNLDSEDEGQLFIGCAGGKDTIATYNYNTVLCEVDKMAYWLSVSGLKGGHSGDDINKGRGNAVKILNRILWNGAREFGLQIATFEAGNLRNAIAREGMAEIVIEKKHKEGFIDFVNILTKEIKAELSVTDPGLEISLKIISLPEKLIDIATQNKLLNSLYACPHGVISMSPDIDGLVETSTNLASVKMEDNKFIISTSQRSSLESSKKDIADMVAAVFYLTGAEVIHSDGYPGWKPDVNSPILKQSIDAYKKLFYKEPVFLAIHAGLECGLIGEKYPGIDMISYGPTLRGVHAPDECIEIESVAKFWDFTLEILKNIH